MITQQDIDRALRIIEMARLGLEDAEALLKSITPATAPVTPPVQTQQPSSGVTLSDTPDRSLTSRAWELINKVADLSGVPIHILRACPFVTKIDADGNEIPDTHLAMDQPGGGLVIDGRYPTTPDGKLDVEAMRKIVDAWVKVCCPLFGRYSDITNNAEIRVGSDVYYPLVLSVINKPADNIWGKHLQLDDSMHHRFDSPAYPHWHGRVE